MSSGGTGGGRSAEASMKVDQPVGVLAADANVGSRRFCRRVSVGLGGSLGWETAGRACGVRPGWTVVLRCRCRGSRSGEEGVLRWRTAVASGSCVDLTLVEPDGRLCSVPTDPSAADMNVCVACSESVLEGAARSGRPGRLAGVAADSDLLKAWQRRTTRPLTAGSESPPCRGGPRQAGDSRSACGLPGARAFGLASGSLRAARARGLASSCAGGGSGVPVGSNAVPVSRPRRLPTEMSAADRTVGRPRTSVGSPGWVSRLPGRPHWARVSISRRVARSSRRAVDRPRGVRGRGQRPEPDRATRGPRSGGKSVRGHADSFSRRKDCRHLCRPPTLLSGRQADAMSGFERPAFLCGGPERRLSQRTEAGSGRSLAPWALGITACRAREDWVWSHCSRRRQICRQGWHVPTFLSANDVPGFRPGPAAARRFAEALPH